MSRKPKQQSIGDEDDQNSFLEINSDSEGTDDDSSYADENSDEENETEDDDQEEGEENLLDQDQDSVQDSVQSFDSDEEDSEEDAPNNESILVQSSDDEDDNDDDDYNDDESESDSVGVTNEKITQEMRQEILTKFHPELNVVSQEEIYDMCKVIRGKDDIIIDANHKTVPILTKYEKTKILGIRAKQINNGAPPLIDIQVPSASAGNRGSINRVGVVDTNETQVQKLQDKHFDGYLAALEELKQKLIPVIIRRPLPDGRSEYWPLKELEVFM